MKKIVKCFDAVKEVLSDANEMFAPSLVPDRAAVDALETDCAVFDILAEEFGGILFDAEVDEITTDITIAIVCEEVIIESRDHLIYDMMSDAKSFLISWESSRAIRMEFVFPGVWNRAR